MGKQVIKTNQQSDWFNKKRIKTLYILLTSISTVVITAVLLSVFKVESVYFTLILFFLLIGLLVVVFALKPKMMYYAMQYRYQLLLANSVKPYEVKEAFDMEWVDSLIAKGFQYGYKHDVFDVLYKVSKPIERSAFNTNHVLEIITIIKDNSIDLYSDILNEQYKNIWKEHQAKHRISKQVIIQFKKYDYFEEDIKADLDRVIAFKEGSNYLISINCGYFAKEQTFYFLHAESYFPNLYYKYAVENIKKLIK